MSPERGTFFAPVRAHSRAAGAEGPHPEDAGGDSAPFSLRGKEQAAGGKKTTAKGEFRFSPFAIPLKTTKKGVATPFLDFSQEFGLRKSIFQTSKNAMQMRIRKTGEVVEILCVSFDFHTSNIQRALT